MACLMPPSPRSSFACCRQPSRSPHCANWRAWLRRAGHSVARIHPAEWQASAPRDKALGAMGGLGLWGGALIDRRRDMFRRAGLEIEEVLFVVPDLLSMITARVPA